MPSSDLNIFGEYSARLYSSPFFDLSNFYMPKNFKKFFEWSRYFFLTHNVISPVVYQMARYPITSTSYLTENDDVKKLYKAIFDDYLNIQSSLISIGLDFFTYGNAFVAIHIPFKRVLICKRCKSKSDADDVNYKFSIYKLKFRGKCPACGRNVEFIPKDETVKLPKKFKIVKYYPGDISIKYNSFTSEAQYQYKIPDKDVMAIKSGDKFYINSTPLMYLKAVEKNSKIIFNKDKLFHFKRDNISGMNMEWGVPLILPAMKKAFYMQILQKSQEAIAIQYIIPLTVLFPQGNNGLNPMEMLNLANWKNQVEKTVKIWKKDPNQMAVFPFPVGIQHLFNEGRRMLVTPEIKEAANQVVAAMGVPQEFVFGGLSWSASSINLRMLENTFMTYRTLIKKFLRFAMKQISSCLRIPEIDIDLKEFKMIDDIQQKNILLQLNQMNKISDEALLNAMGMDQKDQLKLIESEWKKKFKLEKEKMIEQEKFNSELEAMKMKMMQQAQESIASAQSAQTGGMHVINNWAEQLNNMNPQDRKRYIAQMQKEMPETAEVVSDKINKSSINNSGNLPEQRAPRG